MKHFGDINGSPNSFGVSPKTFGGNLWGLARILQKLLGAKIKQKTQEETDKTVSSVLKKDYFFLYGPRGLPVGTTSSRFLGIASIWAFFL